MFGENGRSFSRRKRRLDMTESFIDRIIDAEEIKTVMVERENGSVGK
jgi:hypothetical protein